MRPGPASSTPISDVYESYPVAPGGRSFTLPRAFRFPSTGSGYPLLWSPACQRPPQYRPAHSTFAPAGSGRRAELELNVPASLSMSTYLIGRLLLLLSSRLPAVPCRAAGHRLSPLEAGEQRVARAGDVAVDVERLAQSERTVGVRDWRRERQPQCHHECCGDAGPHALPPRRVNHRGGEATPSRDTVSRIDTAAAPGGRLRLSAPDRHRSTRGPKPVREDPLWPALTHTPVSDHHLSTPNSPAHVQNLAL